jgi:hypothetical protein
MRATSSSAATRRHGCLPPPDRAVLHEVQLLHHAGRSPAGVRVPATHGGVALARPWTRGVAIGATVPDHPHWSPVGRLSPDGPRGDHHRRLLVFSLRAAGRGHVDRQQRLRGAVPLAGQGVVPPPPRPHRLAAPLRLRSPRPSAAAVVRSPGDGVAGVSVSESHEGHREPGDQLPHGSGLGEGRAPLLQGAVGPIISPTSGCWPPQWRASRSRPSGSGRSHRSSSC